MKVNVMKKKTLEKISNGKYFVDKNCTYKKGVGKICNFHISDLTIYERAGEKISFEITLKNSKKPEKTKCFLISYLEPKNVISKVLTFLRKIGLFQVNHLKKKWNYEKQSKSLG